MLIVDLGHSFILVSVCEFRGTETEMHVIDTMEQSMHGMLTKFYAGSFITLKKLYCVFQKCSKVGVTLNITPYIKNNWDFNGKKL